MVEGTPVSSSLAANERQARAASHMNPHSCVCIHHHMVSPQVNCNSHSLLCRCWAATHASLKHDVHHHRLRFPSWVMHPIGCCWQCCRNTQIDNTIHSVRLPRLLDYSRKPLCDGAVCSGCLANQIRFQMYYAEASALLACRVSIPLCTQACA